MTVRMNEMSVVAPNKGRDKSEVEIAIKKKPYAHRRNAYRRKRDEQDDSDFDKIACAHAQYG
jgi:hypothetical protein